MGEFKTLHWNPRFDVTLPTEDQLLLVSETASFLLQGDAYRHLFTHVDGARPIMEVLAPVADLGQQAVLLLTIDQLIADGFLEERNAPNPVRYHHPDFDAAPVMTHDSGDSLELTILSQFDNRTLLTQWASALQVSHPINVVIADEYLDPRLAVINRSQLQQQRPWLLIKLTGEQPLIGPYFTPSEIGSPCWNCLAVRLRYNQPVRLWLQGGEQADTRPVPIRYDAAAVHRMAGMAAGLAQSLIDGQFRHGLRAINVEDGNSTEHPVSPRPQCAECGDPYLFTQRSTAGIALQASPKAYAEDGGFRSRTPTQTSEVLQPIISSLTGVIHNVDVLPEQSERGITIYRSLFFKTPWATQSLNHDSFVQVSLGKGVSKEQSRISALCESVERYAAQYQGDEPQRFGVADQLDTRAVLPPVLAPFSERQYQQFRDPQHSAHQTRQAVEPYEMETPLHWTLGRSLTRSEPVYLPLTYCYANTPFEDERYVRFNSNGCAAGNTLEEAILQGFLELVERDAVAVWWYNQIPRPAVDIDGLPTQQTQPLRATLDRAWDYWALDLTHDLGIPVMAAVGRHLETETFRLGFGCHVDPGLACLRALTELCQLIALPDRGTAAFDFSHLASAPYLLPKADMATLRLSDANIIEHADIQDDVHDCMERVSELGLETIVVNYTRPDLPIYTVKVIVPGFCHIWPRLGAERLYTVPLALGWRNTRLQEAQLNPLALFL